MKFSHKKSEDNNLFHQEMDDVTPHKHDKADIGVAKADNINTSYRRSMATAETLEALDECTITEESSILVQPDDYLSFISTGVQQKLFKQLKQGHIRWEAKLDLHGYRQDKAADVLRQFINEACQDNARCVLIIHGKGYSSIDGKPQLKQYISDWLKRLSPVLAFCSALPREGGTGALYVLLKRNKNAIP